MMRRSCLLLPLLLLASCDFLWQPACLDDDTRSGCQIKYSLDPPYLMVSSSQTLLLRASGPEPLNGEVLQRHQEQIKATLEYTEQGQTYEKIFKVDSIGPNGDLSISCSQDCNLSHELFTGSPSIALSLGQGRWTDSPKKILEMGCNRVSSLTKLPLDRINKGATEVPELLVGFHKELGNTSLAVSHYVPISNFRKLVNYAYNPKSSLLTPVPPAGKHQYFDPGCRAISTKNFDLEYCYHEDLKRWAFHLLDEGLAFDKPCSETNKTLYCGNFTEARSLLGSAEGDFVALADPERLHVLGFSKTDNTVRVIPSQSSVSQVEKLAFARLDPEKPQALIAWTAAADVLVHQNNGSTFIAESAYVEDLKAALNAANMRDGRPVAALAVGALYDNQHLTLLVAKDRDLWLVPVKLGRVELQGMQPLSDRSVLLREAFPEPPERLEVLDLNGDTVLDLLAVTPAGVYLCPTVAANP